MKMFDVMITEELTRTISVEADSAEEADRKVRAKYASGEIVLDSNDYIDTQFCVK